MARRVVNRPAGAVVNVAPAAGRPWSPGGGFSALNGVADRRNVAAGRRPAVQVLESFVATDEETT